MKTLKIIGSILLVFTLSATSLSAQKNTEGTEATPEPKRIFKKKKKTKEKPKTTAKEEVESSKEVKAKPAKMKADNESKVNDSKPTRVMEFDEPVFFDQLEETEKANSTGLANAYSITLVDADEKVVEKLWTKKMRSYKGKTKKDRKQDEIISEAAKIRELGSLPFNVKAVAQQSGSDVVLYSWYESEGIEVSSDDSSADSGVKMLLEDFAQETRREMVQIEIDNEEKELKEMERELNKLQRQMDSYHKDIDKAKAAIAKAEQNIVENQGAQEASAIKIDEQREVISAVKTRLSKIR